MHRILIAEFYKVKTRSLFIIVFLAGLIVCVVSLFLYTLGPEAYAEVGINPWDTYFDQNLSYFSLAIYPLSAVLVTSMTLHQETKSNSWKMIQTLSTSKWQILIGKLAVLTIMILAIHLIFVLSIFLCTIPIDLIHPEIDFKFYPTNFGNFIHENTSLFFSILGIIGVQFFLSLLIKNQILAISLGFLLWIIGFLLVIISQNMAAHFPFSFPMIYKDFGMNNSGNINLNSNVEIKSIATLIAFIILSYIIVKKKI